MSISLGECPTSVTCLADCCCYLKNVQRTKTWSVLLQRSLCPFSLLESVGQDAASFLTLCASFSCESINIAILTICITITILLFLESCITPLSKESLQIFHESTSYV